MIEISLYVDHPGCDSCAKVTQARVEFADEISSRRSRRGSTGARRSNFELLNRALLDISRTAAASTERCALCNLPRRHGPLGGACGGHKDAIRLLNFLDLGCPYPQARWRVTGSGTYPGARASSRRH